MFVYDSKEFNKVIIEQKTVDGVEVTYIWIAKYATPPYPDWPKWYSEEADKDREIWMIRKVTYDPSTWIHDCSYPNLDTGFKFAWNNRDSYNYDSVPVEPVYLTTEISYLMTENLDYFVLE
jgi:hypothetical protein